MAERWVTVQGGSGDVMAQMEGRKDGVSEDKVSPQKQKGRQEVTQSTNREVERGQGGVSYRGKNV